MTSAKVDPERTGLLREKDRLTVLVTDADRGSAITIIRSLGRQGCRVIAAGPRPRCAGFYSRFTSKHLVYPPPQNGPEPTANALLAAAVEHQVDLLVPVTDDVIMPLHTVRSQVPDNCVVAMAEDEALRHAWDKQWTLAKARELSIPCPNSEQVDDERQAVRVAERFGWPVVIKAISSRAMQRDQLHSFEVRYAPNAEALRRILSEMRSAPAILIQQLVPGVGRGVEVLAECGRVVAAFQHRRLREVPLTGGVSSLRESEPLDPQLLQYTQRLIQTLNWTGLAMIEFKQGSNGPRLIEVNGRIWGSLPLAVKCGMDFPAKLLDLYRGRLADNQLDTRYQTGVRCRDLHGDLRWAGQVLLGRRQVARARIPRWHALHVPLGLLSPKIAWDVWSIRDPLPGLVSVANVAGHSLRKTCSD